MSGSNVDLRSSGSETGLVSTGISVGGLSGFSVIVEFRIAYPLRVTEAALLSPASQLPKEYSNVTGERCWCCWQWPSMSGCQTLKGTPAVVAAAYTRAERPLDAACRAPGAAAGAQEEEEGKGQGGWRPCLSMPGFWGRLMLWGCRSLGLEAELNNPTIWSALPATAGCALGRGRRGQRVHEQEEVQK